MLKNLLIIAGSVVMAASVSLAAPSANESYQKGLAAEKAGDPVAAKAAYTEALKANPRHANARYRLGQLKISSGKIAARGREAKFGAVVIPEFRMDGVSLAESVEALRVMVEKESKGEVAPNFIIQDPQDQLGSARITLSLKAVPSKVVFKYLLDAVNAKARFDEHAIVITPR
ncbi:MAG: tetratricopeptide repeat protein [Verrucomicrobiota bacterium JB025]